jgi:tetratricopeptide (TPR) repeat protein
MTIAGVALGRYGQLNGARLALERALRIQPDQLEAARTLADLDLRLGNGVGATHALEIATRLAPGDARLWRTLGKVYHDLADAPNAARAFEKAVLLKSDDLESLLGLLRELLDSHQVEQAESWVARAKQSHPDNPSIQGLEARLLCELGKYDEAISRADQSLASDDKDPNALLARGRSLISVSRYQQALTDLERVTTIMPDHLSALSLLLLAETRLGLSDRAEATRKRRLEAQERVQLMGRLAKEMEERPEDPELRWRLGQAAQKGGANLLAGRCFEAALALDPDYRPARDSLDALRKLQPQAAPSARPDQGRRQPLVLQPGASASVP